MSRDSVRRRGPAGPSSREDVVERAESYILEHLDTRVPISHLCRIVGRSERGLRDAFYSVRGMSPVKYMRTIRLRGAQRTLRHAAGRRVSVTGVATSFGFYELGRFAAAYREAFGEVPSRTLRDASRDAHSISTEWKTLCSNEPATSR